jgi:cell division control protein 6
MESFWRSETPLMQEFVPEKPLLREREISSIADFLKPALEGRKARNILVYGNPGTGKTTISKYVARKFCEQTRTIPIYVNCWQSDTENAVVSRIVKALQLPILTIGVKSEDTLDEMFRELKKNKRMLLLILDEADQLISRKQEKILYEFSRSEELRSVKVELILITNRKDVFKQLDERIESTLSPAEVEFKPYTPIELKTILEDRARLAFREGSYSKELIAVCAARGAKNGGDCRKALECLWLSAKEAEKQGMNYISVESIVKIKEKGEKQEVINSLTEMEKKVLDFISKNEWVNSRKVYELIPDHSERNVRYLIENLKNYGLVEFRLVKEGRNYFTELRKVNR